MFHRFLEYFTLFIHNEYLLFYYSFFISFVGTLPHFHLLLRQMSRGFGLMRMEMLKLLQRGLEYKETGEPFVSLEVAQGASW